MHDLYLGLRLNNLPGALLAFIPALLNLGIVIYILINQPGKSVSRSFVLFTLALVFWQFDDTIARTAVKVDTMHAWDDIFCMGWILVGPLGLFFGLHYSNYKKLVSSSRFLLLLILPAIFFESVYKSNLWVHDFQYRGFWGWVDDHNAYWLDILMIWWITLQVLLMIAALGYNAWQCRNHPVRRIPSFLIFVGLLIPTVIGIICQVFIPVVFHMRAIPLTSIALSIFSCTCAVALSKYKLLNLAESLKSDVLLENMTDIVITLSPEGDITYINPYGRKVLGYSLSEASLKKLFEDAAKFKEQIFNKTLEGKVIDNFDCILYSKTGNAIPVLLSADPIVEDRIIQGILIVSRSIEDIKKAEAELREKNKELQRSNADLEAFAFVASHDMKEPLRMVSNYTQLLAKKYSSILDEEGKEFIGFAVEGVHRMQKLINDLLAYSGIGREELKKEEIDCNVILKDVLQNLSLRIKDTASQVLVNNLPVVKAVRYQLIQLFQNLIENGIKYTDRQPVIIVSATKQEIEWVFSIKDNGIGIDPFYQEKVFLLFQRLHDRSHYSGSGIGLAVCKKIVDLHGGRIWLESQPGQGTTFFFTLPVTPEEA